MICPFAIPANLHNLLLRLPAEIRRTLFVVLLRRVAQMTSNKISGTMIFNVLYR